MTRGLAGLEEGGDEGDRYRKRRRFEGFAAAEQSHIGCTATATAEAAADGRSLKANN